MVKRKNELGIPIDVDALLHSMDYGRWDHPTVLKAFKVLRQLQQWLESMCSGEALPYCSLTISTIGAGLMIGDILIWDSENDEDKNLTFDYCKGAYKEEIMKLLTPFDE